MILTKRQIEEIEKRSIRSGNYRERKQCIEGSFFDLLETVKDLQAKEQKSMELLEAARRIMRHWEVGHELQNQIEEHLK